MKNLTPELKTELLNGLKTIKFTGNEFEHELENNPFTYAKCKKRVETKNLNIEIELEEEVVWTDIDFYEFNNMEVSELKVKGEDCQYFTDDITDDEILSRLNY